jgi:glycerophosphoryl diester phosphodiesterase
MTSHSPKTPANSEYDAIQSIRKPPIGFAHRGARAHAPENTLEAFQLALRLGAAGLESDVWLTADGVPVLDHDGVVGGRIRKRAIRSVDRPDLPGSIPSLEDLYATCGTDFELSLDVKDAAAAPAVLDVARAAGAVERLWLCHPDLERVTEWRELADDVHLVDSTRLNRIREGPERRAATLAASGIDAINMYATDWTGGLTTLFHRFERLAFAWDAQQERVLRSLLDIGVDGVYSDHVDRMVGVLADYAR